MNPFDNPRLYIDQLNKSDAAYRVGAEARNTIRTAIMADRLENLGVALSDVDALEGAEYAVLYDECTQAADEFLSIWGLTIRGYAPDADEAGQIIEDQAVRVEVRSLFGFLRHARVWIQGREVGVFGWSQAVADFVGDVQSAVFATRQSQRAAFSGVYNEYPGPMAGAR